MGGNNEGMKGEGEGLLISSHIPQFQISRNISDKSE